MTYISQSSDFSSCIVAQKNIGGILYQTYSSFMTELQWSMDYGGLYILLYPQELTNQKTSLICKFWNFTPLDIAELWLRDESFITRWWGSRGGYISMRCTKNFMTPSPPPPPSVSLEKIKKSQPPLDIWQKWCLWPFPPPPPSNTGQYSSHQTQSFTFAINIATTYLKIVFLLCHMFLSIVLWARWQSEKYNAIY